jgi:hypothetical protein
MADRLRASGNNLIDLDRFDVGLLSRYRETTQMEL